jgi:peptidoglycan/xylan/chitin deacetylase (PgdA/CDA1 family)
MYYSNNLILSLMAVAGSLAIPVADSTRRDSTAIAKRDVPVGQIITSCTVAGTVALTFDDGPFIYTDQAIDLLNAAGFKATFFVNGLNWGSISDFASTLSRMRASGHQIGSHT